MKRKRIRHRRQRKRERAGDGMDGWMDGWFIGLAWEVVVKMVSFSYRIPGESGWLLKRQYLTE